MTRGARRAADLPEYYNAVDILSRNLIDRADSVALVTDDRELTFGQVAEEVDRVGNALLKLGVRQGDTVAFLSLDTAEWPIAFFACLKVGAVAVGMSTLLTIKEQTYVLRDARPRVLLVHASLVSVVEEAIPQAPSVEHVVVIGSEGDRDDAFLTYESWISGEPTELTAADTHRTDYATLNYSSGTTGRPKGILHSHQDLPLTAQLWGVDVLGLTAEDRTFSVAKLFFTFGLGGILIFPMRFGASTRFLESPLPDQVLQTIQKYKITQIYTAPTAYRAMADMIDDYDISSLRQGVSAGETLPKATWEAFHKATGIRLIDGLGSTELFHIFVSAAPEEMRAGFTGKAIPGYRARVVDDSGNEVPPGKPGQLAVQGPTGCKYLDDLDRQPNYVKNGWNYPGDIYEMDADGYFKYVARADDMIISSGYNISGPEVESVLLEHEAVAECAVIASPDPDRGNIVKAFIVLRDGFDGTDELVKTLQDYVKNEIAPYKYPRAITFIDDLPKTQTGKLQRYRLRDLENS